MYKIMYVSICKSIINTHTMTLALEWRSALAKHYKAELGKFEGYRKVYSEVLGPVVQN